MEGNDIVSQDFHNARGFPDMLVQIVYDTQLSGCLSFWHVSGY